ncbi:uncharacterized protein LOC134326322 [Trichomycterus rosablanca]
MRPFLSVFHAKAHDLKCEVKWSGAYQENAGSTLGEEVEQCNAFLSRIAVTTKHMSKAGRADMLTLLSLKWNKQKFQNMASSLTQRYQKTCKALQSQLENLDSLKAQLAVAESQLEDWVNDVKEWAEATTANQDATPQALCSKIEALVTSIKTRSQRLYKQTDSNKGRHRIRRKIREEKRTLAALVEQYNRIAPSNRTLCMDAIIYQETPWPWQLPCNDSVDLRTKKMVFDNIMAVRRLKEEKQILVREMDQHWKFLTARADTLKELTFLLVSDQPMKNSQWSLTEEGSKGLLCVIRRRLWETKTVQKHVRDSYLHIFSGSNDGSNFLLQTSCDEYYDSSSQSSDDNTCIL